MLELKNHKASVLVVCLWTIMILSILGMGLTGLVFQQIRFVKSYQRISFSLPIARAALKEVFYLRKNDTTAAFDTLQELTQENTVDLCANNSYKYYFADKRGLQDELKVIDESALINLNTASIEVLARLPGIGEEFAGKIFNSGLRPFSSINEVLLVEDMTQENFLLFKDLVTIYGAGKININTASKPVLLALGLDAEMADQIVRLQKENKIINLDPNSTADLGYGFSSTSLILEALRGAIFMGLRQEQDFLTLLSVLEVKSDYLRFNVIPVSSGKEGLRYSIVIHPASKKILSWTEY
jgi:hypothetical protein